MLTVDYDRLGVRPGERVLDLGCGAGRHAFEAHRRGALVVEVDRDDERTPAVRLEGVSPGPAAEVEHALARAHAEPVVVDGEHLDRRLFAGGARLELGPVVLERAE